MCYVTWGIRLLYELSFLLWKDGDNKHAHLLGLLGESNELTLEVHGRVPNTQ